MSGSGGFGYSEDRSQLETQTTPNAYGTTDYSQSGSLANMLQSLITQGTGNYGAYSGALQQAITNPDFSTNSTSQQNMINSLMDQTAARGSVRGLGSPTSSSLATAIAPTLAGFQQQNVQNLMGARQQDLTSRGVDMSSLLELIGYAMPQIVSGQKSIGRAFNMQGGGGYTSGGGK